MSITYAAIARNRITFVLVTLLVMSGSFAYLTLPKAQDPGFIVRTAVITTQFPGASPERVEQLITDRIEKKAQEMPEVDNITSDSRTGISIIKVNFKESYTDMRPIFDELRRKVDDVERDLPDGSQPPVVDDEFGDVFGSVYTLTGDDFSYAELKDVADDMRDILLRESDVAKVSIHGSQPEVIFVDYNNARLTELGLSPRQLASALASVNIISSGGNIRSGRERITLEPSGNFQSLDDLRNTVIQLPAGGVTYLGDIVDVYRDYVDPPGSVVYANGRRALALAISMREGGDIIRLGQRLDELMPELIARYPYGIDVEKVWFQADLVEASVSDFTGNLMQAIAIVIIVMIAFLGVRTGIVVASLIPITLISTLYVMQVFGITINQISLAALIISLGLLVDNAIVVVEAIVVKRGRGMSAIDAAVEAGKELKSPLLISSLTTAAAFMPIALAESAVGEYTSDIFYVVTISLLLSWILAMTFIPMLTTVLLKPAATNQGDDDGFSAPGYRVYRTLLVACLRRRAVFLAVVIGVFALAIAGMSKVRQQFIAPSEDPVLSGKLELPLGTSIEASQDIIADLNRFIEEDLHAGPAGATRVRDWLVFVGEGGPRFTLGIDPPNQNAANSFLIANTVTGADVLPVINALDNYVRERHPDLAAQIARLENGPPVGYPIIVRLSGENLDTLYRMAAEVAGRLYKDPRVSSVQNTWGLQTKKLIVDVNQDLALRWGVTSDDVAYSLKAGLVGIDLTQYRDGDLVIPVTLRTVAENRQDLAQLEGLSVYSQSTGENVPLKQVADARLAFEPGIIERRDRLRTMSLNVQIVEGATATDVAADLVPWLDDVGRSWPARHEYELGGELEESGEANASIAAKMPIAGMLILLLLVAQFNSMRRPVIILATIPLGLIGVTFGLLIADSAFGFFTLLGLIALAGIIINNAIVLIDRIRIEIEELGKTPTEAVVSACLQRLRPILLTTATTVLGMMPLWWGGTAMFEPMAITIIFGLAFATALTLLVVPVLYSLFFSVNLTSGVQESAQPNA